MTDLEAIRTVAARVKAAGGRALLVGGCVRDALLAERGRASVAKDFDVEVYGLSPERLQEVLARDFALDLVGVSFGVVKLHHFNVDVALPRRETKLGEGHRAFEMAYDPFLPLAEASARRDFTINAIYRDPLTDEILDPWNGRADLAQGVLRHVSSHFAEDPLRVLRGMQFVARFDLKPAAETVAVCRAMTPEGLPPERLMGEWSKLLQQGRAISKGLDFLRAVGWVRYYPELAALIGCRQDPHWHPEGDVWNHTLCCLDAFAKDRRSPEEDLIVGLAVLCHDFGKPAATRYDPVRRRIRSLGHDEEGVAPTLSFLRRLTNEERILKEVPPLVRYHMRPYAMWKDRSSDSAIRRLAAKVVRMDRLLRVAAADDAGRPPYPSEPEPLAWLRAQTERLAVADAAPKPILLGRHLIARGLKPGPSFRRILDRAYEAQLDGRFADLNGALAYLDRCGTGTGASGLHIIWDWNGTLLDDVAAEVNSLNAMLARRSRAPVSVEFFRDNFAFPARAFYRLVGMDVPDDEWDALAREYHDTYHAETYGLNADARAALELAKSLGARQSILSALHQTYLDCETQRFGVRPYMECIYGVDNLDGGSKLARARELMSRLSSSSRPASPSSRTFVLIGDSIHDGEVARALGIRAVLFSGGSHSRARLEPLAPVGDTLEECVRLAFTAASRSPERRARRA